MLSDVTNKPENQRYLDVRECFSHIGQDHPVPVVPRVLHRHQDLRLIVPKRTVVNKTWKNH